MVLIDDKKYACEACIKGHRSSSCKHTDRPLYEIKKKGRPVTQCEHCRELRKTKQVHVKCMCEVKPAIGDKTPAAGSSKKGNLKKVLASAAFPEGLPEALGSSVAQHASSEDISSDSEQGDGSLNPACNCKNGDECHCFSTRTRRKKPGPEGRRGSSSYVGNPAEGSTNGPNLSRLTLNNRVGDLHPVPPRLFPTLETDPSYPAHPHMHPSAPRTSHGTSYFNPYGRAYEEHFHLPESTDDRTFDSVSMPNVPLETSQSTELPDAAYSHAFTWPDGGAGSIDLSAFCTCGDSCSCAGCVQHRDAASWPEGTCANPGTCTTCITCSLPIAIGPTTPPTTPSTGFEPPQFEPLDDWIRSISTITPPTPAFFQPAILDEQINGFFNGIPRIVEFGAALDASHSSPSDCCNGRCKCSLGQCTCPPDCCGCCHGCQCEDHEHESQPVASGGDGTFVSYAVSGERTPCCGPNSTSVNRGLCPAPPASSLSRVSSTSSRGSLVSMSSSGPPSLNPGAHFPPRQRPILPKASSTTSLLMNAEPSSVRGTWSQSTTDVTSHSAFPQQAMGTGARLEGSYQDRTQRLPYDPMFSSVF